MRLNRQNRQLVRIAGSVNLLMVVLCIIFALYLGYDNGAYSDVAKKVVKFTLTNVLCWAINVSLVLSIPLRSKWNGAKWLFHYLPSYLITSLLAIVIAHSFLIVYLSDEPLRSAIAKPIFFVIGFNTLSLVAIELIQTRLAQADIRIDYANMKAENAELRIKSLEAQHEKLKNQLHPHFLFNSLNALKTLIRKDPGLAEEYLLKLSGFLRFSMSHNEQNVVPLEEELRFSLNYLEMQKIRFRNALTYTIQLPEDRLADALLPVFSLQLTLENAIKHNQLTQESPLCISIGYVEPDWLVVENNIQAKLSADPASGVGLKNLSDRYRLLIHEDISIKSDSDCFRVYLKIIRP